MRVHFLRCVEKLMSLSLIGRGVMRVIRLLHHDLLNILIFYVDPKGIAVVYPRNLPFLLQTPRSVVDLHWRTVLLHCLSEMPIEKR
jgi:hypothetical protein